MFNRSCVHRIIAAIVGVLLMGPLAIAQSPESIPATSGLAMPYNLVSTPAPASTRRPIMALLDQTPVGRTLDDWGMEVYGHIEVGFTYNFDYPSYNLHVFRPLDLHA